MIARNYGALCAALLLSFLSSVGFAREKLPDWLTALAALKTDRGASHPGIILLDESVLEVSPDGVFTTRTRWAARILTREGRKFAQARVPYDQSSQKVKSFKAWTLRPDQQMITYGRDKVIDTATYSNALELYADARQQTISAVDDAIPESVFGFESVVEERAIFGQLSWAFQCELPAERSSFSVTLPPGWKVQTHLYNLTELTPEVSGNTTTWIMTQLPAAPDEPMSPNSQAYQPWIAVDLRPPTEGPKPKYLRPVFETWRDVASYFVSNYETAATPDAEVKSKASAITANASTLKERLQALCRHAQRVNYISIGLDTGNGGGFIPRAASRVLRCNYGDCKDKSTLLRSLLSATGVRSYPVVVYSGDSERTRENWPSPLQFNHCIVAIEVDETVQSPAVAVHPTLGRLLFFDPTNEITPLGYLPSSDAGAQALILSKETEGLFRLPQMEAAHNRWDRTITVKLAANGEVTGRIQETFTGQASSSVRSEHRQLSPTDYQKRIERWLGGTLAAPQVRALEAKDAFEEARFTLGLEFGAQGYGKCMQDRLLVFKPVMVARRDSTALRKTKRTQPVVLTAMSFSEHSEIELPAGFRVDEKIAPVELKTTFGRYRACATEDSGKLIFERSLEITSTQVPPSEYDSVRAFFEKILQSEQTPVVLERL